MATVEAFTKVQVGICELFLPCGPSILMSMCCYVGRYLIQKLSPNVWKMTKNFPNSYLKDSTHLKSEPCVLCVYLAHHVNFF